MEVKIVKKVLDANDTVAEQNRAWFAEKGVFVLNVMSSPGAGKTTLLARALKAVMPECRAAVIVGDVCSTHDAERLAEAGVEAIQINTDAFGGECHLGAHVVRRAAEDLDLDSADLVIVENIGNLVCPAEFDIGEDARMVVLSITEGEDKPVKYPLMFRVCETAVINKIDLLPHLNYDMDLVRSSIFQVHPEMTVFELSAVSGEGMEPWLDWLKAKVAAKKTMT